MPKRAVTEDLANEQEARAKEFQQFRKDFLFTQKKLAEVLGLSRRTIQAIESGQITPHAGTIRAFIALKTRHEAGRI
jgi:DNA-binding XRE family transcriptional regulator